MIASIAHEVLGDKDELVATVGNSFERHPRGLVGRVFRVITPKSVRIGNCWMAGRLKKDDLCLCLNHSGDCFQNYMLVEKYDNGIHGFRGSEFGSYGIGDSVALVDTQIGVLEMARLKRGEYVNVSW